MGIKLFIRFSIKGAGVLLSLLSFCGYSQTPSNILMVTVENNKSFHVTKVTPVTNNDSYTNQPYFVNSGKGLYFTQAVEQETEVQMDSFYYDINTGQSKNITRSALYSEYSPTPLFSGTGFSTILVDPQGKQWLWQFSENGDSVGKLFDVEPIGYHVWESENSVLAFVLGEPNTLQRLTKEEAPEILDTDIGPSLWSIPKPNVTQDSKHFSYTKDFGHPDGLWLMSIKKGTNEVKRIAPMPSATYYAWLQDGSAIVAQNAQIMRINLNDEHPIWSPWLDLSSHCENISRIHSHWSESTIKLAVVCESE